MATETQKSTEPPSRLPFCHFMSSVEHPSSFWNGLINGRKNGIAPQGPSLSLQIPGCMRLFPHIPPLLLMAKKRKAAPSDNTRSTKRRVEGEQDPPSPKKVCLSSSQWPSPSNVLSLQRVPGRTTKKSTKKVNTKTSQDNTTPCVNPSPYPTNPPLPTFFIFVPSPLADCVASVPPPSRLADYVATVAPSPLWQTTSPPFLC